MSCRICLSDETPETFVSPCQCIGTAAFIHQECLNTYFTYYPDRICRVCMTQMECIYDPVLSYIVFGMLGVTITYSGIDVFLKLGILSVLLSVFVYYTKKHLFNDTVVAFLIAIYLTFVTGGHPDAVFIFLFTMYMVSLSVTFLVTRQLALFVFFAPPLLALAIRILLELDGLATSVYVSLLFLIWYASIRTAVGNRANPLLT
jgi:hypothetical protein